MGIKNIPEDYREFKAFHLKYEKENFNYSKSNSEIAKYTRDLLISFFVPKQLAFLGKIHYQLSYGRTFTKCYGF